MNSLRFVQLFATPWTVACQSPLSMGFSRQAYWSGLPFPSPGDLPNPGIEPRSPVLQADTLSSEPPGKSKNTGVGCHSLLQEIFLTHGLNPGLPHYRQMLYRLSHQGSPREQVEKRKPLHSQWGYKLVQPLWKMVWSFLKKLNRKLPYDPAIPLLGFIRRKL